LTFHRLSLLLSIFFASTVLGLELKCDFVDYDENGWGEQYTCNGTLEDVTERNVRIQDFSGEHALGKDRNDVESVYITDQNLKYLPHNFIQLFPKMDQLYIFSSNLEFIERGDFSDLVQLRTLSFYHNHLKNIPDDVFIDMINLEYLSLSHNRINTLPSFRTMTKLKELYIMGNFIVHFRAEFIANNAKLEVIWAYNNDFRVIDSNAFDHLIAMKTIDLGTNPCIDKTYHDLESLKVDIVEKCPAN